MGKAIGLAPRSIHVSAKDTSNAHAAFNERLKVHDT
jgi:hypothetical protein